MAANIYYEKDVDRSAIADKKVAVLGYGSQGHAHALNLKESGIDVRVGLREGSGSVGKAEAAGLAVPVGVASSKRAGTIGNVSLALRGKVFTIPASTIIPGSTGSAGDIGLLSIVACTA